MLIPLQEILSPASRGSRRVRHRPVLVLELEDRLVFHRRDVPDEQHLYSGTFLLSALARMA